MISGYKKLTGKYLKASKKRTILTIIGIMLSVALICTIGLFFKNMQDAEVQDMKNKYGSFHVMFKNTNEALVSRVINNPKVARYGFFTQGEDIKIDDKLSVSEMAATDKALELLPYKIKDGKLPEEAGEAAVERWILDRIGAPAILNTEIKLGSKAYKLTGILENSEKSQVEGKGILLRKDNNIDTKNALLLVEVSPKAKLRQTVNELKALSANPKDVGENVYLLVTLGAGSENNAEAGIYIILGVIIGIVVISTIAVIYNSFQISVVERIRQFGILRAVGTTPKQIRTIVLREATVLSLIAIPLGLILGIIATYSIGVVFRLIGGNGIMYSKPDIAPEIILLSTGLGLAATYLSAMIPAFFAAKVSPLTAISSRSFISKEKIKRRRGRLIGKLFGFEGALAAKNIKRNKKRYRITVFSIVISVVLFVTFKSFMDMVFTVTDSDSESNNVHFTIMRDTNSSTVIDGGLVNKAKALNTVDKLFGSYEVQPFAAVIDKGSEVKEIRDLNRIYQDVKVGGQEKIFMKSSIIPYDTGALAAAKKYVQSGTIDEEALNQENGVIVIGRNNVYNQNTRKSYFGAIADLKVGDTIEILKGEVVGETRNKLQGGEVITQKVKVLAVVRSDPFEIQGGEDGLKLITSVGMAERLVENNNLKPVALNISLKNPKEEEEAKKDIEALVDANSGLKVIDNIDSNRKEKSNVLMLQILVYGFVVVVSLIGSVNIINTVTTNIILRRREFAALKSIGLTQGGLKKMIVLEGILYGIVGAIVGSIIGSGLYYLMFKGMVSVRELRFTIPWNAIIIAGAAALIISYLSVLAPLSRIKKENLMEAIREDY
ncbi:MAG: FtsX-like permease family protein [Bacillota bacterium]|nr:FtsX-like permease family protein [Bacillota bacterium]